MTELQLIPERPRLAGVAEEDPGPGGGEGAHVLADECRDRLRRSGFTDGEIDAWAGAYVAEEHSGDADRFIAWVAAREHGDGGTTLR